MRRGWLALQTGFLVVAAGAPAGGQQSGSDLPLTPDRNTDQIDYCPMVTPDGRYLFFSRRRGNWAEAVSGDVYWVDVRILDRFRPGPR